MWGSVSSFDIKKGPCPLWDTTLYDPSRIPGLRPGDLGEPEGDHPVNNPKPRFTPA